jgi:hypothetical protein
MRLLPYLAVAMVAAIGGWMSRGVRSDRAVAPPAIVASPRAANVRPTVVPPRCDGVTVDQMRALLADQRAPAQDRQDPERGSDEPGAATALSLQRIATIEAAAADGVWSPEDRELLRRGLVDLSPAQRDEVVSKIVVAVNAQTLQLQAPLL